MKTNILTKLIFAICLMPTFLSAHNQPTIDTARHKDCLVVMGKAIDLNNEAIEGAHIVLYRENEAMEWDEITSVTYHEHNFVFTLESNSYYTVEISKQGYVTRSIGISTLLPAEVSLDPLFRFEFDVQLFKKTTKMDEFYLDFPVALISFDKTAGVFGYSRNYTNHIKKMIGGNEANSKTTSVSIK